MSMKWIRRVAVAVVVAVVGTAIGLGLNEQWESEDPTVVAYFADASPLVEGSLVKAAGVDVGNVSSITLEDGQARVEMTVNPAVLPLHRDASLNIRPVNLLGEQYIKLDTGSQAAPLMPGSAVIPASRTDSSVDLQDVIKGLQDPVATSLAALLTSLGKGVHSSGAEAAAAIKSLRPAMMRTDKLAGLLNEQNQVLNQLIDQVVPVATALASGDGKTLNSLVESTEQTLSTVVANRKAVDETLAELPETIADARRTLSQLAGTANAATPTLASIRPITDDLTEIAGELYRLADVADPALASLQPVLDRANELLNQAAPVVAQLRPAGPDLRNAAAGLKPLGHELLGEHLNGVLDFVVLWAMSTNGEDGLSHYFRGVAVVTPTTLKSIARGTVQRNRPGAGELPKLGEVLQNRPQLPALADALPDSGDAERAPGSASATGLTRKQERSMLGQLLGGL